MAGLTIIRYLVNCDGCGAIFGDQLGFETHMQARALAYAEGWRFPSQFTAKGAPGNRTFDVCPSCIGTWGPTQKSKVPNSYRQLSRAEIGALPQPKEADL